MVVRWMKSAGKLLIKSRYHDEDQESAEPDKGEEEEEFEDEE